MSLYCTFSLAVAFNTADMRRMKYVNIITTAKNYTPTTGRQSNVIQGRPCTRQWTERIVFFIVEAYNTSYEVLIKNTFQHQKKIDIDFKGTWLYTWHTHYMCQIHWSGNNYMMTSSNGSIFCVTGPLCGEFTGPGEFPTQRPVTRSFDVFFDLRLNKRLSKQPWGWWFETPPWSLWRHCNVHDYARMNLKQDFTYMISSLGAG